MIVALVAGVAVNAQPQCSGVGWPPPDLLDSQVTPYWNCNGGDSLQLWNDFQLYRGNQWVGYGYDRPCDMDWPLGRALNGLWMLRHAGTAGFLGSGWWYAQNHLPDNWDQTCGDWTYAARTIFDCTFFWCTTHIEIPMAFAYSEPWLTPAYRAAVVLHETRHVDGYDHDAGDQCADLVSCDSSWQYQGANYMEIRWLADFITSAYYVGSEDIVNRALLIANQHMVRRFEYGTGLRVDRFQGIIRSCEPNCDPPHECPTGEQDCCGDGYSCCRGPNCCEHVYCGG